MSTVPPKEVTWEGRITIDPKVMVGKPVVRGTRLTVELIVERLAGGWSFQDLIDSYPGLTVEDIHACLAYAVEAVEHYRSYELSA